MFTEVKIILILDRICVSENHVRCELEFQVFFNKRCMVETNGATFDLCVIFYKFWLDFFEVSETKMSNDRSCYIKFCNGVGKAMFCNVFLNLLTMELEFDALYEVKVFACNHSMMNNDDETTGVCYMEFGSRSCYLSFQFMMNDVFANQEFEIDCISNDSFNEEFLDGFIVWQI